MDDRPTDEHRTARTVTLVVPLPDRTAPDRPVRAPYIERPGRTEDRTPRPVERTGTEQDAVRPTPVETVRPVQPPPVRTTVRPEPVERLVWQTVDPGPEPIERQPPGDGGRTHLKIIVVLVPAAGAVGGIIAATGLPSLPSIDIRPVLVVVGTVVLGIGITRFSGVLRAIVAAIAGGRR